MALDHVLTDKWVLAVSHARQDDGDVVLPGFSSVPEGIRVPDRRSPLNFGLSPD